MPAFRPSHVCLQVPVLDASLRLEVQELAQFCERTLLDEVATTSNCCTLLGQAVALNSEPVAALLLNYVNERYAAPPLASV